VVQRNGAYSYLDFVVCRWGRGVKLDDPQIAVAKISQCSHVSIYRFVIVGTFSAVSTDRRLNHRQSV
jgi:hypothetical protein